MAPFIKFTEEIQTAKGEHRKFRYVNAEAIASAQFIEQTGELKFVLLGDLEKSRFTLKGEEAAEALKVLQSL